MCTPKCFETVIEDNFYGAGFLTGGEHRSAPETDYLASRKFIYEVGPIVKSLESSKI